jgi:hypothetical protein
MGPGMGPGWGMAPGSDEAGPIGMADDLYDEE